MSTAEIMAELRATAPPAPDALRDRVRTIAARETAPRRSFSFTPRRTALVLVGAVLVAAVGAAVVRGLVPSGSEKSSAPPTWGAATSTVAEFRATQPLQKAAPAGENPAATDKALKATGAGAPIQRQTPRARLQGGLKTTLAPGQLPPAGFRLQDYDVSLGVRVADSAALSKATVNAMRYTRVLGGFVARVSYDTPGTAKRGESELLLRVPVDKVQDAMQRFSGLGTLTSQHVSIQDLQGTVNTQTKRIITLNRRIGAILKELDGSLTVDRQARLTAELAARKQELAAVTGQKRATVTEGRLAHIYLTLSTKAKHKPAVAIPHKPGRIERRLDEAGEVLARELAALLYGLIVAAPFALLGAGLLGAARMQRRRTDRRVLARS